MTEYVKVPCPGAQVGSRTHDLPFGLVVVIHFPLQYWLAGPGFHVRVSITASNLVVSTLPISLTILRALELCVLLEYSTFKIGQESVEDNGNCKIYRNFIDASPGYKTWGGGVVKVEVGVWGLVHWHWLKSRKWPNRKGVCPNILANYHISSYFKKNNTSDQYS